MSVEFVFRLIGMTVFFLLGVFYGAKLGEILDGPTDVYAVVVGLLGALIGLILTPFFTSRPANAIRNLLGQVSAQTLLAGLVGLMAGLVIAALLAFPLSLLPEPFRNVLPFVGVLFFSYIGVAVPTGDVSVDTDRKGTFINIIIQFFAVFVDSSHRSIFMAHETVFPVCRFYTGSDNHKRD